MDADAAGSAPEELASAQVLAPVALLGTRECLFSLNSDFRDECSEQPVYKVNRSVAQEIGMLSLSRLQTSNAIRSKSGSWIDEER